MLGFGIGFGLGLGYVRVRVKFRVWKGRVGDRIRVREGVGKLRRSSRFVSEVDGV